VTDATFWQVIAASRAGFDPARRDGNMAAQTERLNQLLEALPTSDIQSFGRIFHGLFWSAYRWVLWAAAYIIGGGCSDDGFTDFRYWLISMGRDVFTRALADPESLVSVAGGPGVEDVFFEEFGYVADAVLEDRGVEDDEFAAAPDEPEGEQFDDDELPQRFPKLWAAFGEK
jgi:hypothetical protein